jgi:hypothetical protein
MVEELLDPVQRGLALGNADEAANEDADHAEEKAVAFKAEGDERARGLEGNAMQGADGVGLVGVSFCGEGREVVGAFEEVGGGAQEVFLNRERGVPSTGAFGGEENAVVPEAVGVDFAGGAESGVEGAGGLGGAEDAQRGVEAGVERTGPLGDGKSLDWDVGVGDLADGVDAGIGPA